MIEENLAKLVAFKTISGDRAEIGRCFDWIASEIAPLGLHVERPMYNGVESLVVTTTNTKSPKLFLCGHLDVVGADASQFTATIKDGKLFGRGAFDMKFATACYIELLHAMKDELGSLDFGLMLTSDEEVGGWSGTAALLKDGYSSQVAVIPDSGTNWQFESSAKGGWWLTVRALGASAHASRPWLGTNAIDSLMGYLSDLKQLPIFAGSAKDVYEIPTMNIGRIAGGEATNQVARSAEAHLDIRSAREEDRLAIERAAKELAEKHSGIEIISEFVLSSYAFDRENSYFTQFTKIAKDKFGIDIEHVKTYGSSDARFFAEKKIPTLVVSPKGGAHHSPDEWVDLADLERFTDILKDYVRVVAK